MWCIFGSDTITLCIRGDCLDVLLIFTADVFGQMSYDDSLKYDAKVYMSGCADLD